MGFGASGVEVILLEDEIGRLGVGLAARAGFGA